MKRITAFAAAFFAFALGVSFASAASTLQFTATSASGIEGSSVVLSVSRTGSGSGTSSVNYTTVPGSALAGSDYTTTSGVLTWLDSDMANKTVTIPIVDDGLTEPTESFTVTLSNPLPTGGGNPSVLGANTTVTVFITTSSLAMAAATQSQVESVAFANVMVFRSGNIDNAASINYSTSNGTAIAGSHYMASSGTLTWAACDGDPKMIQVPIIDNTVTNSARTFNVTLSAPVGGSLVTPSTTAVTIDDDDNVLQFSSPTYNVTEGTPTVTINVTRTGGSAAPASVTWTTANGTAVAGSDFGTNGSGAQRTGTLNWAGGDNATKSFTVPILNNSVIESPETFTVVLSNPVGLGTILGAQSTATVTITDDETGVSFAQAGYTVVEGGSNITVSVNRTASTANAIGVTWTTSNGTAVAGQDFGTNGSGTQRTGTLSWAAGDSSPKTFTVGTTGTVPILNDTTVEGDQAFTITLSNPTGGAVLGAIPSTAVTITDNDSTIQFSGTALTVGEIGTNGTLSVTRVGSTATAASVTYTTSPGSATAGTDYTHTTGTITWAAGDGAAKNIAVGPTATGAPYIPVLNDALIETPETFTVTLSAPTGGGILGASTAATVTINSEDSGAMMALAAQSVAEAAGTTTVTVNRFGSSSGTMSVNYATASGTAIAGTHFTSTSGTLNWADGDPTPKTFTVPIINNAAVNPARDFSVALSGPVGAVLGSPTATTVTITDDDNTLQFTSGTGSVTEGAASIALTVSRTGVTTGAASVTWTTANGTAVSGSDFGTPGIPGNVTGVLNWAAGDAANKTVTIPILNDALVEGNEAFTVTLSAPTGAGTSVGATPSVAITLVDDESTIQFSGTTLSVGETGANGTLTVTRVGSTVTAATVTFTTAAGTATAASDFTQTTGVLNWVAGDGAPRTITVGPTAAPAPHVPVLNDAVIEGPETFNVVLTAPTGGGVLGANSVATVTINSEDAGIAMATATQSVPEPAGSVAVIVNRIGSTSGAVSVNYATANGTALAGTHYTTTTGTLNWANGDGAPKTITVPITDNTAINANRTFTVTLSGPVGASLGTPAATTVTIADDDNTLQFTAAGASVTEGTPSLTLTVSRTGVTTGAASVTWSTANGTAVSGSDFGTPGVPGNVTGVLNWAAGDAASKTITIPILNDAAIEPTEDFSVNLSAPVGTGVSIGTPASAAITLNDDEASVSFSSANYTVVESGPNISVTVNRSGPTTNAMSVTVTTGNGSAIAGQDFGTMGSGAQVVTVLSWGAGDGAPKSFAIGNTFPTIAILNDSAIEVDETFGLTLSNPTGGASLGAIAVATVTIADDDSTIQFSGTTLAVGETGANGALTLTRSGSTATAASVTFTTVAGSATAGSDFTQTTGTVTWAAGDSAPKTIAVGPNVVAAPFVRVLNDAAIEAPEAFTVVLSAPTGGGILGINSAATVTINSEDAGIAMAAASQSVAEAAGTVAVIVNRAGSTAGAISVNFATANGTALAGTHYTTTNGTLNWANGDGAPKTITVPIIDNAAVNAARTFTVTLSGPVGAVLGTPAATTVTIGDDDNTLQLTATTASVTEGTPTVTLTVSRLGGTAGTASVTWSTANGTAVSGSDFGTLGVPGNVTGTLNWAAGDAASKAITIPILNDAAIEAAETFAVNLSGPVGPGVSLGTPTSATVTITDDEVSLNLAQAAYSVLETGPNVTVTVNRSGSATNAVSVTWTTANGTATAGQDFGTNGSGTQRTGVLSWAAGDSAPKTFTVGPTGTVPILNDTAVEGNEAFTITLSNPTGGAALGPTTTTTVTITDDDSTIQFSGTTLSVGELGANGALTVTRVGSTLTAASVTFTTVAGTAAAASDFTQTAGTLTWAAGDATPRTIAVGPTIVAAPYIRVLDDALIEGPETFTVVLSAPTGGGVLGAGTTATVTINSEDSGIAMATASQSVSEATATIDVTVNRTGSTTGAISVNFATANGSALAGTHYTATTGTLNWASGDGAPKTITVPIIDNAAVNANRTFNVTLSGPVGAALGTPVTTTVTITDDDNTLQLTAASASVTEGTASLVLTVSRTGVTTGAASVTWTTANGTAVSGSDFGTLGVPGNVTGTLNWAAGDGVSKTITIPILNDTAIESAETFTVNLSGPTGSGTSLGTPASAAITLNDDDAGLSFASATYSVTESGPNTTVSVNRSGSATSAVSVTWTTANGTATAGQDFGTLGSATQRTGTLSWAAGDSAPKTFTVGPTGTVPVLNDVAFESNETFTITLSNPTGGATIGPTTVTTVTILDDESTIQFSGTTLTVGETGANGVLTVTRVGSTATAASVNFATAAGSASAGSDFTQTSGTLTWAAGDGTPRTIAVGPTIVAAPYIRVLDDALIEGPETFTVTLSAPTGGGVLGASTTATVTINSEDAGIAMTTASQSVAEAAGTVDVIVNRAGSTTGAISVNFATANGSALAGTHYTTTAGTLNWADGDGTPKTITVPIIDNAAVNAARTFNVTLSGPVGASLGTPVTTTVTIADDDNTLQFTAPTATVTEGTPTLTLTVSRLGGTAGTASVTWTTANGTAVSGSDFGTLGVPGNVTGTLNWAAGDGVSKTITIPILNDAVIESAEAFSVNLSAPVGTGVSIGTPASAAITLNDDDAGLSFASATYTVTESGPNITVAVNRSGSTASAVSVTWTTADGTATAGQDFGTNGSVTQRTGTLSWAAGDSAPKTFTVGPTGTVPVLNDVAFESDETFTITLSNPTGGAAIGPTGATTVTILDNESTIQFSGTTLTVGETGANGTLTVTRVGSTATAASVNFATAAGSASAGSDFTQTSGTLTWAAGDGTPRTIAVGPTIVAAPYIRVLNDTTIESPETFTVVLSAPTGGGVLGAGTTAIVTINSEDAGIAMTTATQTVAEGAGTVDVTVSRAGSTTGAISVNFATANGSALAGTHYTTTAGTLNWADGDGTPKTITVPIIDNAAVNANRTFNVTLSGAVGAVLGTPVTTTVTIGDDDNTLQFTAATSTVTEGTPTLTLTVSRLGGTTGTASVTWTTANGTAVSGSDFGALGVPGNVTGTLNWAAGDATAKTIAIPILNDAVSEAAETFTVNLSAPVGVGVSLGTPASNTVTVNDDEISLNFAQAGYTVVEGGANVTVSVTRSGAATGAVSVTWTTADGTAVAGQDFGTSGNPAQRTGTLSWAAGDGTPKTFSVGTSFPHIPILNDTVVESSETFTITLSNPTGAATIGPTATTTITITDNDSTVEFGGTTLTVGETGANGTLTVTRTGSLVPAVSVNWATVAGTAAAGSDFTASSGTLSWAAGDGTPRTIAVGPNVVAAPFVRVLNDTTIESPETFTVVLSAPTAGAVLLGAGTTATVTITSEDAGLAMAVPTQSVAEGAGSAVVSVNRAGSTAGAVSVNFATANGTALAGTHYTAASGTLNWADGDGTPKTITVTIADNAAVNASRTFNVTLSAPVGAALGTPVTTTVTIADDDNTLQFTAPTASVTEGTPALTLTVSRLGGAANPASVTWTTTNGTAVSGSDFGALGVPADVTGTLNWAAADATSKTLSIPILDDAIVEGAKAFTVTLSAPTGATLGTTQAVAVTLNDNDAGLVFGDATYVVNENTATVTLTVNRIGPTTSAGGVTWTTANGTAISGTDFGLLGNATQRTGTLAWAAGNATPRTFTVPILDDAVVDGNKSFTVTLSAPTGGLVLGTPGTATVTILDDETAAESTLQFGAVKYLVSEAAGPALLSVTRTGSGYTFPVSVNYTMTAGSALAGPDFTTSGGTLSWASGDSTAKTITIPITNDAVAESPEQFTVTLSAPTPGAGLGTPAATTVEIIDNDEPWPPLGGIPPGWMVPGGASAGWHVSNDAGAFDGVFTLKTDAIDDGESAQVEVTGNYLAGTLTFRVRVSSELNFDFMRFYVDGVQMGQWSGTANSSVWQLVSVPVAAGVRTFRWSYEKDASGTVGEDAARIDAVVLPPPGP